MGLQLKNEKGSNPEVVPGKSCGFKGWAQHLRAVYSLESRSPKFFAGVDGAAILAFVLPVGLRGWPRPVFELLSQFGLEEFAGRSVGQFRCEDDGVGQLPFGELLSKKTTQFVGSYLGVFLDNDYG